MVSEALTPMTMAPERGTMIGRLRVSAAARDSAMLRMRSEALLRSVDLQPASLPPQAILCIRSLCDPLPSSIDLVGRDSGSHAPWRSAARASVESLARRAVRPALESVPAAAEAVLFLDRAELLACAARDAVRGLLGREWWWTYLFDVRGGLTSVVHEWTREPRCVPAVMALLARRRSELVAVLRMLAPEDARRVVEGILREHELPAVAYAVVRALTRSAAGSAVPTGAHEHRPLPQWTHIVPEAFEPAFTIEQQVLAAVSLLLQRAPGVVRAPSFANAIVRWIVGVDASISTTTRSRSTPRASARTLRPSARSFVKTHSPDSDVAIELTSDRTPQQATPPLPHEPAALVETPQQRSRKAKRKASRRRKERRSGPHAQTPSILEHFPPSAETGGLSFDASTTLEARPAPEIIASYDEASDLLDESPYPAIETQFTSDFAGALFLFNAGIALGFYSDFTSPIQRGIGLDVFLFVDRVGRALAGNAFARDPIHAFLRRSAARASRWTPPPVLAAYPNAPRRDRWIAAVANHLRLRLGAGLARRLVAVPGRITASLLHLDAYFSLEAHPIEIRMAGLDRNPGWIPAAGRHVAFHFD